MATIDLVKEHPELYKGKAEWARVNVPPRRIIAVDGAGDPNTSSAYAAALTALYGIAFTAKFALKKAGSDDFKVAPLEGLWWADDYASFISADKDAWKWTMFIPVPDVVTDGVFEAAREAVAKKHPETDYSQVELRGYDEGDCVQALWVGPYAEEFEVLLPLHQGGLAEMGLTENGLHHEIYLSDPRRTAP
ncbi:MAG: GyrI-like domain-containing protein [Microbacteriaceae bacterium]